MSNSAEVEISNLGKSYGSYQAVRGVSILIRPGEIVGLLGPSGCGKTTTLRIIAGLETPDEGTVTIAGKVVNEIPVPRRNVGMVFQNYALFPHMTVAENIAFGLKMRRVGREEIRRRVAEAMDMVRLPALAERLPSNLSGGQRQRVALARALVSKPSVLLLDEPLSALDRALRQEMQIEIRALQQRTGVTTVFVTHDQEEALTLSDRIAVMNAGRVVQIGTPNTIYDHPATRFVSDFIGLTNAISCTAMDISDGQATLRAPWGQILTVPAASDVRPGPVELVVRPEKLTVNPDNEDRQIVVEGVLRQIVHCGAHKQFHVDVQGTPLMAVVPNESGRIEAETGSPLRLGIRSGDIRFFGRQES